MRKRLFFRRPAVHIAAATIAFAAVGAASCSTAVNTGTGGGSGTGGGGPVLQPGESCGEAQADLYKLRIEPSVVFVTPCKGDTGCLTRLANVIVDPDVCSPMPITFESADAAIAPAPEGASFDLHQASTSIVVRGGTKTGTTTLKARLALPGGKEVTAEISVVTLSDAPIACSGTAKTDLLKGGDTLSGTAGLAGASIRMPEGADAPNSGSFLWSVEAFGAQLACGAEMPLDGYTRLGPAITFGPEAKSMPRELPLSIPMNPALMPEKSRFRHLRIAYSGPGFKEPRIIPIADPRIENIGGQWAVSFGAPRFGTYQAVVRNDAGATSRKRRLTHRAAIGISMGGGGTATFGMRHHDLFDVLAPLGGPVDWTWLLHYIENNHLGGFRSIPKGTTLADIALTSAPCEKTSECKSDETCLGYLVAAGGQPETLGKCVLLPTPTEPYAHPSTFNNWWYEYPRTGNGGSFAREEYTQIFRDLALMYGNPNGENLSPGGENLPAGVRPDDKSQLGDHPNGECSLWLDPLDGPGKEKQQEIAQNCPTERCKYPLTLTNYFDDEYNPDGTFPVITVCDGNSQKPELSPYANTWHPEGNDYPLELGLAVDYNGNGVRDELEPIIRAGHEKWYDDGVDGIPSALEPGYALGVNDDPAGDDYNAQYNPTGTEGDHRWQQGEKFDDFGLDGVPGTKPQPMNGWQQAGDGYDVGEGDGKFTVARGLQRFWDRDAHSITRQMVDPDKVPGGALTDDALARIDVWTDGGTRDLFNFAPDAQNLAGTFVARKRPTAYYTSFAALPGLDATKPADFTPGRVVFEDVQGVIFQRYGLADPTPVSIEQGSGQHVGTAPEILARLQTALYFIGSRWPEPELRRQWESSQSDPAPGAQECEVLGTCNFDFTSKGGRTGPVGVTLPPGYAHSKLQHVRYPVIYMLHGYGQTPQDLEAVIVLASNWMNGSLDSSASRLPKAIIVYVDGRCRPNKDGKAECIRGTFFADSARKEGAQDEQWWLEMMDEVDQKFRTLGESEVDWTE